MIHENEIVMLFIGGGVLILILKYRSPLKRLPASKILLAGFFTLLAGWVLTVLEEFFWNGFLNYLEHLSYAGSSLLVLLWCWIVFGKGEGER
jgi:hypothetical protein